MSARQSSFTRSVVVACSLAAGTAEVSAQRAVDGNWGVRIVQPATGCDWVGQIRLSERAGRISGRGQAAPSSEARQPARCPRLEGQVEGERRGEVVRFGFATGRLGKADFEGRLDAGEREMHGTWRARSASGQWAAGR
jgi:hypothetical protein